MNSGDCVRAFVINKYFDAADSLQTAHEYGKRIREDRAGQKRRLLARRKATLKKKRETTKERQIRMVLE